MKKTQIASLFLLAFVWLTTVDLYPGEMRQQQEFQMLWNQ